MSSKRIHRFYHRKIGCDGKDDIYDREREREGERVKQERATTEFSTHFLNSDYLLELRIKSAAINWHYNITMKMGKHTMCAPDKKVATDSGGERAKNAAAATTTTKKKLCQRTNVFCRLRTEWSMRANYVFHLVCWHFALRLLLSMLLNILSTLYHCDN